MANKWPYADAMWRFLSLFTFDRVVYVLPNYSPTFQSGFVAPAIVYAAVKPADANLVGGFIKGYKRTGRDVKLYFRAICKSKIVAIKVG